LFWRAPRSRMISWVMGAVREGAARIGDASFSV